MITEIYKKFIIDFPKVTLLLIITLLTIALYHARNFNLDASSDALILDGDKDLKYLRQINERYGSKDFLVLTYSPVSSFEEKETILNLQLLKSKINLIDNNQAEVVLFENEYGISPGQACVFYKKDKFGDKLLGGGWIKK